MVSISYFVRSGTNTIYFSVSKGREFQIKRSTQKKLNNSSNWIAEKHKVSQCKQEPFANSINNYLANHKSNIVKEIQELQKNQLEVNEVNVSMILNTFEDSTISKRKRYEFSFTEHLEEYVKLIKSGKKTNPKDGKPYRKSTIKGYQSLIENIKKYEKVNPKIKPHKVDSKLYDNMKNFFKEEGFKDGYIGVMLSRFQTTIKNYLVLDLKIEFKNYNSDQWKKLTTEKTLSTYLSLSELNTLLKLDLSGYEKEYDNVRDAYCFIAFTCGIRIGDYERLTKDNLTTEMVNGKKIQYIEFTQSKTGSDVKAPLNKIAVELIKKHNGFPRFSSQQKSNKILKKLGMILGFDNWIENKNLDGKVIEKKRRYDLMVNHSSRRSFCTNAWDLNTDLIQIMSMSGHRSPDILLGYIGKTRKQMADRMLTTEYFKSVNDLDNLLELKAV